MCCFTTSKLDNMTIPFLVINSCLNRGNFTENEFAIEFIPSTIPTNVNYKVLLTGIKAGKRYYFITKQCGYKNELLTMLFLNSTAKQHLANPKSLHYCNSRNRAITFGSLNSCQGWSQTVHFGPLYHGSLICVPHPVQYLNIIFSPLSADLVSALLRVFRFNICSGMIRKSI